MTGCRTVDDHPGRRGSARALRELLDCPDLGYAVKDPASLKYLEVNRPLAGWLGSTPEAMTARPTRNGWRRA